MRALQEAIDSADLTLKVHRDSNLFGPGDVISYAIYSKCERYRYVLCREWALGKPMVAFIGLNPSTATEQENDPTVARCIQFAQRWGCGGMWMLNAFAYRATDPKDMKSQKSPVGPWNSTFTFHVCREADRIVCCWGTHATHRDRHEALADLLSGFNLTALKVTKDGMPGHPLYLKGDLEPKPWTM